jgi:hypothetical protein
MRYRFSLFLACLSLAVGVAHGAPRIDNVLIRMVPPGPTSLVGAHMDQLTASELYQKLIAQQKLPQLDQFARDTGFDPRHDVREILMVNGPQGSVLLARGNFNLKADPIADMKVIRHGQYNIRTLPASLTTTSAGTTTSGFCILDSSLAAAGEVPAVEAALDEWTQHGAHKGADALLASVTAVSDQAALWGVSTGFASFLASNLPGAGNGLDFSAIFRGIESSWFSASVGTGLQAAIHCTTASEKDAMNLRDAAKGLIGFGRLSVPQNKPDLLRFWDGLTVDQSGRAFALNADIPGDLIDQMVQFLSAPGGRGGSGRGGRGRGGRAGSGARGLVVQ